MRRIRWSWRDLLFDVAPVAILLVVGLLDVAVGLSTHIGDAPAWSAIPATVIACLSLLIRRRLPLLSLAAVLTALIVPGLFMPMRLTYWGQYVPWLVAMYSTSRHLPWRRGVWAIPMTIAGYSLALLIHPEMRVAGDVLFNMAVLLGLWSIGRLAASWSGHRDRNLLLEFERTQAEERAEARERTRIARELHDVISHSITVIVMQAGGARLAARSDPRLAVDALARIEELGRGSLTELRALLEVLRRDGDDEDGTAPQPALADLPALCDRMRALGLPTRLRIDGDRLAPAAGAQLTAYRVVQEGLTNVLKHAGLVRTDVEIRIIEPDRLIVDISNAPGAGAGGVPGAGRGIVGLRERIDALGGRLDASERSDGGFRLRAELPSARSERARPEQARPERDR